MALLRKKTLSLVLSGVLAISALLAGCSGSGQKENGEKAAESESQVKELSIKVHTTYFSSSPQGTETHKKWQEMMEKYLGAKLNITWEEVPWNDYNKQMPIYLASGDFADIFTASGTDIMQKVNEAGTGGLLVNLAKYSDKLKYYKAYIEDPKYKERVTAADGGIYGFADGRNSNHTGTQLNHSLRFDVFQKHNIKPPETMDEYYTVAKKLKELYPQSYPVGSFRNSTSLIDYFLYMNHTSNSIYFDGKKYVLGPVDQMDRNKEVLVYLNKLYKEGLLDPEFFVITSDQARQKMLTDKVFMVPNYSGSQINDYLNFNKEYPAVKWGVINHPKNFRGEVSWKMGSASKGKTISTAYNIVISTKTKYPDLLVKLVDYQYSDEMLELANWGIEGVTFKKNPDGSRDYLPAIMNTQSPGIELGKYGVNQSMSVRSGIQFMPQESIAGIKLTKPCPVWWDGEYGEDNYNLFTSEKGGPESVKPEDLPIVFDTNEQDQINNIYNPIKTYLEELVIKVVTGKAAIADWEKYVTELRTKGDYKIVLDMYNKKADAFNKKYNK